MILSKLYKEHSTYRTHHDISVESAVNELLSIPRDSRVFLIFNGKRITVYPLSCYDDILDKYYLSCDAIK